MNKISPLLPGYIAIIILLAAPSLPFSWWMFLPIILWGLWRLRPVIRKIDILVVSSLPVWAMLAEFIVGGAKNDWKYVLGYWGPQIAAFLVARVLAREASKQGLQFCLLIILSIVLTFTLLDSVGIEPQTMLPSYKDTVDVSLDSDVSVSGQSGERRIRGFYGESSILSAALVVFATLILANTPNLPPSKYRKRWVLFSYILASIAFLTLPFILSKSGFSVLGVGLVLASIFWLIRAKPRQYPRMAFALALLVMSGFIIYVITPPALVEYLENETEVMGNAMAGRTSANGKAGTDARLDYWRMTIDCMARYPLGSGVSGTNISYDNPRWFNYCNEMHRRMQNGTYGLLNQWANVGAQTGIYGWVALFIALGFHLKGRTHLWWRAMLIGELFTFLFTVESFPFLALIPLAGAVVNIGHTQKTARKKTQSIQNRLLQQKAPHIRGRQPDPLET